MGDDLPLEDEPEAEAEKWPIGFILTIATVVLYLGWRLVQGILWLVHWLR